MKNVKQILGSTVLALTLVSMVACKGEAKEQSDKKVQDTAVVSAAPQASVEFKTPEVNETFTHYIQLKTALVNTDATKAKQEAEKMANASTNAEIKSVAQSIAAESDIAKQREQFSDLTTLLKPVLLANLSSGSIYEQHCPMALKDGANWFALEEEVNNPYYGDKMLHCGVVQETIN